MTQQQLLDLMDDHYARMREMFVGKNQDYAVGARQEADALIDFSEEAQQLGLTPEQVLHVYASKHWRAVTTFCRAGRVESEAIEGRVYDMLGYMFLLLGLIGARAEGDALEQQQQRGQRK